MIFKTSAHCLSPSAPVFTNLTIQATRLPPIRDQTPNYRFGARTPNLQAVPDQGCYLIDFYHVCEYLGTASAAIAPDPAARSAWMETQKEALKGGRLDAVLRALAGHCEPPEVDDDAPCEPAIAISALAPTN